MNEEVTEATIPQVIDPLGAESGWGVDLGLIPIGGGIFYRVDFARNGEDKYHLAEGSSAPDAIALAFCLAKELETDNLAKDAP